MAESRDLNALQRRGRRRLVGAIALVLLAVIVLPMVFDPAPKSSSPPVSVRIPSEDDADFKPKVTPKGPASAPAVAKPEANPGSKLQEKAQPSAAEKTLAKAPVRPAETPAQQAAAKAPDARAEAEERRRAENALADARYIIPVAALASADKLKELTDKLVEAKLPYYTEQIATAKGPVTRVRAGPFGSQQAAEQALEALKGLGLKPGNVTTRS